MPEERREAATTPSALPAREDTGGDAALTDGDAIARAILADLAPLEFGEARDAAEGAACLALRYRAVLEMRMAPAESWPDGLEHDAWDAEAVHVVGRHDRRPVATSRVLLPSAGRTLPTAAAFGLRLADPEGTAEWGRMVVDPAWRGDGHSVFLGLAAQSWLSMRARGFSRVIGATPRRLVALFDAIGFSVTVLGEPRRYWGEERVPILGEARPTIRRMEAEWLARPGPDEPSGS